MSLSINVATLSQVSTVPELVAFDDVVTDLLFGPPQSDSDSDARNYSWSVLGRYRDLAIKKSSIEEAPDQDWARAHFADDRELRIAASLQILAERCFAMIPPTEAQLKTSTYTLKGLQTRAGQTTTAPAPTPMNIEALRTEAGDYTNTDALQRVVERVFPALVTLHERVKAVSEELTRLKGLLTPEHRPRGVLSAHSTPTSLTLGGGRAASGSTASTVGRLSSTGSTASLDSTGSS